MDSKITSIPQSKQSRCPNICILHDDGRSQLPKHHVFLTTFS